MKDKITVLNTGGTFNKRYNPIKGALDVPTDHIALDKIIPWCHNLEIEIIDVISKDSLEIKDDDRQILVDTIKIQSSDKIIVIHGTDTVDATAKFVKEQIDNKKIVFTGAMIPMSIDEVEATMNFSMALGFLSSDVKNGAYLAMHGIVAESSKLLKNKELGKFILSN